MLLYLPTQAIDEYGASNANAALTTDGPLHPIDFQLLWTYEWDSKCNEELERLPKQAPQCRFLATNKNIH